MRSIVVFLLYCLLMLNPQSIAIAGSDNFISIVPDPSCRSNKLDVDVEQTLADNLKAPGLKISNANPSNAFLQLRYVLRVQAAEQGIVVQLDGEVFGDSNKLYAEASVRSDSFPDDENGRTQAARQAGRRLGQELSDGLLGTLARPGHGRRVILQVTLTGSAIGVRQKLITDFKSALASMSFRLRPSTQRSIMMTLITSKSTKGLAVLIEKSLAKYKGVTFLWQVKTKTTMMLKIKGDLNSPP